MNQCEQLVLKKISDKLKLHAKPINDIKFVRCYRIGKQFNKS